MPRSDSYFDRSREIERNEGPREGRDPFDEYRMPMAIP